MKVKVCGEMGFGGGGEGEEGEGGVEVGGRRGKGGDNKNNHEIFLHQHMSFLLS